MMLLGPAPTGELGHWEHLGTNSISSVPMLLPLPVGQPTAVRGDRPADLSASLEASADAKSLFRRKIARERPEQLHNFSGGHGEAAAFDTKNDGKPGISGGPQVTSITVNADPRDWRNALACVVQEVTLVAVIRAICDYGITESEMKRYMDAMLKAEGTEGLWADARDAGRPEGRAGERHRAFGGGLELGGTRTVAGEDMAGAGSPMLRISWS
eukprot:Skav211528  [mRNA]  locus=scaffold352:313669:318760:- [translate_table: standard]